MIEINAHPVRLDLDWVHCKRAKALGVLIVINPDAHNEDGISDIMYGVNVARRGCSKRVTCSTPARARSRQVLCRAEEEASRTSLTNSNAFGRTTFIPTWEHIHV